MSLSASNDAAAGALFQSTVQAAGVDVHALGGLAQVQLAIASLYADAPPGSVAAGDIASGTFGANIPDTGTYAFPGLVTTAGRAIVKSALANTFGASALIGGDTIQLLLAELATDATNKTGRIGTAHYTNSEEPLGLISGASTSTAGTVNVGGGTSLFNAATGINFYTAANNTTTTGTIQWRITSTGALTGDLQPSAVSSTPGTAATPSVVTTAAGGNTTIATTGAGGKGGDFSITTGTGGTAAAAVTAATGGAGGDMTLTTGAGTAVAVVGSGTGTGGKGGAIALVSGVGGAASTSTGVNLGGASGAITFTTAAGGAASNGSANTGGASGVITLATGNGGAGATAAGNSGAITLQTGTAGSGGTVGGIVLKPGGVQVVTVTTTGATTGLLLVDGSAYGAGVASIRLNGLTTAAINNQVGTLTNAPSAGDPAFWVPISIAGSVRYFPVWS